MQSRVAAQPLVVPQARLGRPDLSAEPRHDIEPLAVRIDRRSRSFTATMGRWRTCAAGALPFVTPEFLLLVHDLEGRPEAWLHGAERDSGDIVAALPLVRRGRTLVALRGEHSPRFDLAGDESALPTLWRSVRDRGDWDTLELLGVPACSALAVGLPDLARRDGYEARVRETHRAPWFLATDIEQRVHRRFRGDMRRLERQLGGVELERVSRFDHDALREALRLEAAAWKGAAGTAIACDERLVRFYAAVARLFARRGQLTIAFLRARGRRIAAQIALEDATTYHLVKTGYDPEFAHFGPGQLLVRETAANALRRGLVRYDLMGRDTSWKAKWTEDALAHVRVTIYAPTLRGRARCFAAEVARPLVGRALRTLRLRGSAVAPVRDR
jgi:CelD/BcsL family acetyltransferase involved in cellulose biosynthesis